MADRNGQSTAPALAGLSGLTSHAAAKRLLEEGYNELPAANPHTLGRIVFEVIFEPMILMLIVGAALYVVLGSVVDAMIMLVSVAGVAAITIYQQRRTERVLDALRDLSSPRALVLREGRELRIPGREVVRGDVMLLREGDRVAADALVLDADDLLLDESLLTGESVPVRKSAAPGAAPALRPGGDGQPHAFAGTLIVKGHGIGRVTATGSRTEMGKIGVSLKTLPRETTPLQRQTGLLVRNLAVIGLAVCLLVAVMYGASRNDWTGGLLAGLTLAMAILPEEFPVVLTVFLALGAWRISRERVLTRRAPAIETLGSATVLAVDKTGTLTENRMAVHSVWTVREGAAATAAGTAGPEARDALRVAMLASEPRPFDPMERAVFDSGHSWNIALAAGDELVRHYPISSGLLAVTHAWRLGKKYGLFAKGAPEAIMSLCRCPDDETEAILEKATAMARSGLRVLGVASAPVAGGHFPDSLTAVPFRFIGLIGFADPVRPTAPAAVRECRGAGIRVLMITGDYPETAKAIAREVGLENPEECLSGEEMAPLSDAELAGRLARVNVFARIVPAQKLRIVEALKARGEIVAMTGDGVNDAPALRAAHIGIAMGGRGTDVAREAASLVLLDDDFASIAGAVRLGRRIFDNLRKAMSYILAVHIPTVGMTVIPVAAGWPLVFFPVHIVFLELVIDPACSIAFEAEPARRDAMQRPPRDAAEPLFGGTVLLLSLLQGLLALAFVLVLYWYAHATGRSEEALRALAFSGVVAANLYLIFFNRGAGGLITRITTWNRALWVVVAGTLLALGAVLAVPALRSQFRFALPDTGDFGVLALGLLALIAALEALRLISPRPVPRGH
ncbi:MAG: cation-translocating P-type ATPase [Burkholderiales bacterium]